MGNLITTYQNIADILSFDVSKDALEKTLKNDNFDWDNIVVEGSKHLVLPAIYCQLKKKQLTHLLPQELDVYLKDITTLNKNRNTEVIKQINVLSELLNTHNIDHVFLKGAALISGNYYENISERMLGDIDILIPQQQLDEAFKLLNNNSYYPIDQTLGDDFFEHKHLPRLKTDTYICAVELHRKLFVSHKEKNLSTSSILASKDIVNGISIPSAKHLLHHNILNYQINDHGKLYNSISFRPAYDTIVLLTKCKASAIKHTKTIRTYFSILGLFFRDINKSSKSTSFIAKFYLYKLKHPKFYKFWNKLLKRTHFLLLITNRIPYFIFNNAYRTAVIKDRKRIFIYFRSVLSNSK